jgi:Ribbon-helix-helix domain
MKSPVIKRTVYVNGRKTGICLEDAFWSTLKEIAHAQVRRWRRRLQRSTSCAEGNPIRRDPPVRARPGPFKKSGGHRGGRRQPLISAASFGGMGDGY